MKPIESPAVAAVFNHYPVEYQKSLLAIRQLIFDTADTLSPEMIVAESLKWNQPSYSTKFGSPIRIDRFGDNKIALLFHCQTSLVGTFRAMFADLFEFSKNRAIVLDPKQKLPVKELALCIEMALTYHKK
ncbi:DUF1801 domain-containing protein [Zophobihabitans entericus]|uniref:DUF1801 domain-containing protein n=1 Tax=Zophobihabitans entericus TaxID=1635327 RepID=A0A6G9IDG3_9GAMM|nr:DUF1801 domain-containing protein [Zophobihabitans entericus]QIQ21744.1 DUF1801 domain-containing protein [Zophobihabitans entericus]